MKKVKLIMCLDYAHTNVHVHLNGEVVKSCKKLLIFMFTGFLTLFKC